MYLGYSTWGMPTVPIDVAIAHIAGLGFDGLELTVIPRWLTELSRLDAAERRRIRQLYVDAGLALPSVAGHTPLLAQDPTERQQNIARLQRTADFCAEMTINGHTPPLNTTVGGKSAEWEQVREALVEGVGALAAFCGSRGVTLAIEAHVGNAVDTPERAVWLMEHVNSPFARLNFDISHFNIIGRPIEETVAALAPWAAHTHVKDERGMAPDHQFLIPGEGDFDYVRYLRAMDRAGYTGFITAEISVMVQRRPSYDPLAAATQSYAVLNQAFHTAGIIRPARSVGAPATR